MKTEWDYTKLADAYLKRPDYAESVIDRMIETAGMEQGGTVCDIGAGAAHFTIKLAERGLKVCAVEPNDAMRSNGIRRTTQFADVSWFEGVGEHTGMDDSAFDLVTFGSSFNVCDRQMALKETARILKSSGWFACMWNHRDLEDPLQQEIESILKRHIENYSYGTRREDQTGVIEESGLFGNVIYLEGSVIHEISSEDFIEGWKSHGTVYRQSLEKFSLINDDIKKLVESLDTKMLKVPYTTRVWMAQYCG